MLNQVIISIIVLLLPTYLVRWSVFNIPTTLLEIVIYIALILTLVQKSSWSNLWSRLKNRSLLWLGLFVIANLVGVIIASDKTMALGAFKGWIIDPILVMLIVFCQSDVKKTYQTVVLGLSVSGVIVAIWGLFQSLGLMTILLPAQLGDSGFANYLIGHRAVGPFESPNYLAMYLVPVWFILLGLKVSNPTAARLKWVSLAVICLAVVATQSLGGWLAFIAGLVMSFVFWPSRRSISINPRMMLWLMALGVGMAVIIMLPMKFESSIGPRLTIWRDAVADIFTQPILGQGLRQYAVNLDMQSHNHPHNLYLATWIYSGLFGLLSFLALTWQSLRETTKNNLTLFLSYALVTILVHGLIDTTVWKNDLAIIFWIIIGLIYIAKQPITTKS